MIVLRLVRTIKQDTLDEVADVLDVSRSTVQQIEANRCDPGPELRQRIAEHYGLPYKVLTSRADDGLINDLLTFLRGRLSEEPCSIAS